MLSRAARQGSAMVRVNAEQQPENGMVMNSGTTLRPGIDWVGFVDWNVRDFHGYTTDRGATYNAYLVQDEHSAVIDTVKAPFVEHLIRNVAARTELAKISYVVCNHAEPDHSSGFTDLLKVLPQAQVVCNAKCQAALAEHYDTQGWKFKVVSHGETLRLGRRSLTFVDTPMVHWPESMATYVAEEKLLFSMDAFGQHFSSSQRFDDENPLGTIMEEARIYYANIVTPYSARVVKTMEALAGVPIEVIAPSHGVIWRRHLGEILKAYRNWSHCKPKAKVVVLYDTMWGSTGTLAQAIYEGASLPGVEARIINLRATNLTRVATEILDCAAVAFGSSTLNQCMLPTAAAAVNYLTGLRFTNRVAFAFGSYGWGKGGPEAVDEALKEMKWDIVREPLKAKFRPKEACLAECRAAGGLLAEKALVQAGAAGYEPLVTD
jgi:flavorubredoxin